jgi:hypothetical protein
LKKATARSSNQKSRIKIQNPAVFLPAIILQLIENSQSKSQTSKCVMMLAYGSPRGSGKAWAINFGEKMSESRELGTPEEDGATLVTPRFDEEETVLAQPVVRLDAEEEFPPAGAEAAHVAPATQAHAGRRQWPLALILISALAGSVIGGTGLYFFQKHRRADAAPPASPAPAESAQPQPEPEQAAEVAPESNAPVEAAPAAEETAPDEDAPRKGEDKDRAGEDTDAGRADRIPAPAPPPVHDAGPRKQGKKAEPEDDAPRRRERRTSRDDDDAQRGREARRVDTITYPTRREERRAERRAARRERRAARNVDRLRAIFEGQP